MAKRKRKQPAAVTVTMTDTTPGAVLGQYYDPVRWEATAKLTIGHRVRTKLDVTGPDESTAIRRALYALAASLDSP